MDLGRGGGQVMCPRSTTILKPLVSGRCYPLLAGSCNTYIFSTPGGGSMCLWTSRNWELIMWLSAEGRKNICLQWHHISRISHRINLIGLGDDSLNRAYKDKLPGWLVLIIEGPKGGPKTTVFWVFIFFLTGLQLSKVSRHIWKYTREHADVQSLSCIS